MAPQRIAQLDAWTNWLNAFRKPLVLVFAPDWGRAAPATLEGIVAELRRLGSGLVVVTASDAFCFRADYAHVPSRLREPSELMELFRRYEVDPKRVAGGVMSLALLDEDGRLRIQTAHAPLGKYGVAATEEAVLDLLTWARKSAAFGTRVLVSRGEAVLLSLTGALALSMAEACTPKGGPPPKLLNPKRTLALPASSDRAV